jgi:thioredoxin-dependent peroxiredoxin
MVRMKTLKAGIKAPDFTLPGSDGRDHTLSDYKGGKVLLYFYPKDNTPGCTVEAEVLRDSKAKYKKAAITVFGISTDSVKSHQGFAKKLGLPFVLLADTEKKVVNLYGVWGKKKFMGREYMGTKRQSFLIGEDGKILKIYEEVKPKDHAAEVLADAQ